MMFLLMSFAAADALRKHAIHSGQEGSAISEASSSLVFAIREDCDHYLLLLFHGHELESSEARVQKRALH